MKSDYSKIGQILASGTRLGIVLDLAEAEKLSFNELKNKENLTPGNLNYHLQNLQLNGIMQKTEEGGYTLTELGRQYVKAIKQITQRAKV